MRVWDIPVDKLCNKHLIAQHHEIHCVYNIITQNKKGFAHHPEVMRWRNHITQLRSRHELTVSEMLRRGFKHNSPMGLGGVYDIVREPWQPIEQQIELLRAKGCDCKV